jgi:hypothetical protein
MHRLTTGLGVTCVCWAALCSAAQAAEIPLNLPMLELAKQLFFARHPWSAFAYFVLGVVAGAFVGIRYSFKAQRPRLRITGGGGSSGGNRRTWSISISNYPSFLGQRVDGASAKNVRAQINVLRRPPHGYQIFWNRPPGESQATVEPGQQASLLLFHQDEHPGYFVADATGKAVARFREYSTRFTLTLADHLDRVTTFPFRVEYDVPAWIARRGLISSIR